MKMIANASQLTNEYVEACELYLLAQAYLEQVKADVTPIKQRVIDTHYFRTTERIRNSKDRVTSYTHDYLMSDADFSIYLAEVIPQVAKLGYKVSDDPDRFCCPFSAAKSMVFEVRRDMLKLCAAELEMFSADELAMIPVTRWDALADTLLMLAMPRIRTGREIVAAMFSENARPYYELCHRHR